MAITYTRVFTHTDWQDNVDRVQAGGGNGFNKHFHDLEGEFDRISGVVTQIDASLTALGQTPNPQPTFATLTPVLIGTSATPWSHQAGFAQKPPGQTSAAGMMSVSLPHRARIQSLRVTGRNQNTGGTNSLRIFLQRQGILGTAGPADRIARADGTSDPFDVTTGADPNTAVVDNQVFKYFIVAQLDNAAAADTIILTAFQIIYVPSAG
jgi:hypothetical protein